MKVKNIFIIEDDELFALSFDKKLEALGDFKTHRFISVEGAIAKIETLSPEIIFLDHMLGGVNGINAIPLLKELAPSSEIVVVSGQRNPELLAEALDLGAAKYFSKDVLLSRNAKAFIQELNEKDGQNSGFWNAFLKSYQNVPTKS